MPLLGLLGGLKLGRKGDRGGRKGTSFIHPDGWVVWTRFLEDRDQDPVHCPLPDPSGGVSGPAVSDGPPAGPDEATRSGGAGVDQDQSHSSGSQDRKVWSRARASAIDMGSGVASRS